ncbi:MAG: nucleotide exchange factor GrpE [Candidatus Aphodosoma sp.]
MENNGNAPTVDTSTESQGAEQTVQNEQGATDETKSQEQEQNHNEQIKQNEADELKAKYDELNNNHLRLMAEFDNYRKRTIREKADLIKNASERIITDFLPIIDNFERAIKSMETAENIDAVRQGVELIYTQVMNMMKNNGVTAIETEGREFDTEYHEAITTIPSPTPEMKDKIIDCTTRGYMLNDKVIRHAKVVVGA